MRVIQRAKALTEMGRGANGFLHIGQPASDCRIQRQALRQSGRNSRSQSAARAVNVAAG